MIMKNKSLTINFKKYKGKHLVILNDKIISFGASSKEAMEKAIKKYPKKRKDFYLFSVPKTEVFIYATF